MKKIIYVSCFCSFLLTLHGGIIDQFRVKIAKTCPCFLGFCLPRECETLCGNQQVPQQLLRLNREPSFDDQQRFFGEIFPLFGGLRGIACVIKKHHISVKKLTLVKNVISNSRYQLSIKMGNSGYSTFSYELFVKENETTMPIGNIRFDRKPEGNFLIRQLFVDQEFCRNGIATTLFLCAIALMERIAAGQDFYVYWDAIPDASLTAQELYQFYENLGGKRTGFHFRLR